MIEIDVPGFGFLRLEYLISDYNGTLALDGHLSFQVRDKLNAISKKLKIFIVTSDEFGKANQELKDLKCELHIIKEEDMAAKKAEFVTKLGSDKVVAFGNGMNDTKMLSAAKLGIIISGCEGCAIQALLAADIQVTSPTDGLDLLLNPKRLRASLKF